MTAFEFIDHATISRKSRKIIRSHVMKGKNAGKTRQNKPKPALKSAIVHLSSAVPAVVRRAKKAPFQSMLTPKILMEIGHGLSGIRFASHFPAQSRRTFLQFSIYVSEAIYPPEVCTSINPLDTIWFHYMLLDEVYFHCFLALAASAIDFALGKDELNSAVKKPYFATAIQMVNHRLSMPHACADSSIAAVINLAIMAGMRCDQAQMRLHLDGLCLMIDMRGGIKQLSSNFSLVEKVHRVDVEVALHYGSRCRFDSQTLGVMAPSKPMLEGQTPSAFVSLLRNLEFEVAMAARDVMAVSDLLNDVDPENKLDPLGFQDLVLLVLYQLIDIRTKTGLNNFNHLNRAVLLGLMGFMTTMLVQFGRKRRMNYIYVTETLQAVMSGPELINAIDPEAYLWLWFVMGQSALEEERLPWAFSQLQPVVSRLEIRTWEGVLSVLERFPWVNVFGDSTAHELWTTAQKHWS